MSQPTWESELDEMFRGIMDIAKQHTRYDEFIDDMVGRGYPTNAEMLEQVWEKKEQDKFEQELGERADMEFAIINNK